jgi:hypothetical protein
MKREGAMFLAVVAVSLLIAALLTAGASLAQGPQDPKAATAPVMAQLEAFRRDDYDAAFAFASEAIQRMFGRQAFEQMVRRGYPEIARSTSAHVAESRVEPDDHAYVRAKIRGSNGNHIEALYDLVWEGGHWRINGVVAKPDPGLI